MPRESTPWRCYGCKSVAMHLPPAWVNLQAIRDGEKCALCPTCKDHYVAAEAVAT